MNNLEKLITNLSNYWDISPDKVVDRLNFMNEQEINKLVDKMTKKFKNGGFIDCLRAGGTIPECKCGKKIAKGATGMGIDNKKSRVDAKGSAYTYSNGTDVLTRDAVGSQPMPGSYYSIPGSTPEYETHRQRKTNKGGDVEFDLYNVYLNDGDHFGPVARYTTRRSWRNPRTWFRILLSPKRAQEMQAAYDINGLKQGGELSQLPKKKKNYLKK